MSKEQLKKQYVNKRHRAIQDIKQLESILAKNAGPGHIHFAIGNDSCTTFVNDNVFKNMIQSQLKELKQKVKSCEDSIHILSL